jgi:hypothetical protein
MPLEPDDLRISPDQEKLNRQLEALQRFVSDLQQQRDQAEAAAQSSPAPEPRPSRRWLLVAGLLVVLALVGGVFVGAVAWSDDRPAGAAAGATNGSPVRQQAPSTGTVAQGSDSTAAPVASRACKTAVDRANTMLAIAVGLQRTIDEYGRIMTDPSSRELSGRELVDKSAPVLRTGTSASARFTQALADYRKVVDQCQLQAR